jgi:hypothetical protein
MTTKRILVTLVTAVIATLITVINMLQPSVRAGGSSAPQLEGSWQVTVTSGSGQSTSLATFSSGGWWQHRGFFLWDGAG